MSEPNVYVGLPGSITTDGQFVARTITVDAGSVENVLPEWLRVKRVSDDSTVALFTLIDVKDVDDLYYPDSSDQAKRRKKKALLAVDARTAKANTWFARYTWRTLSAEGDADGSRSANVRLATKVDGNRVLLSGLMPEARQTTWTALHTFNLAAWMPAFPSRCFLPDPPANAMIGAADEEGGIALIDVHSIVYRCIPPPDDFRIVRVNRKWLRPF